MSGFAGNTAHGASEKPGRRERYINLTTARQMLPLVKQIMGDVQECRTRLARLQPELDQLDRQKRTLDWSGRCRRYQVQDELSGAERNLQDALLELDRLGVAMLDPEVGQVGFPTKVNSRPAYFSWIPGEDGLHCWLFVGEAELRPIPALWLKAAEMNEATARKR